MRFGALGDVHGDADATDRVMRRHPDIPFWVAVGDVGGDEGVYRAPAAPLYWIKGNNEDFDFVAALERGERSVPNLHFVPNATVVRVAGVTLAGLGGTYAPRWFDTAPGALPYPGGPPLPSGRLRAGDDKRRHFVRDEVEACRTMRGIDLFLTHEAPRPFLLEGGRGRFDAGKPVLNTILAEMRPRLHLFGHHHRFSEAVREGVPSVGLGLVSDRYLLIETETMRYEVIKT
jgi:hypothetical protein